MTIYYINSSDSKQARLRTERVKQGAWLMLTKGVYTDDLATPLSQQVASAIIKIIGERYPDLVISHRSAYEYRVHAGCIYVTGSRSRTRELQGIKIIEMPGPAFMPEYDQTSLGTHISGTERMLLENLEISRGLNKTLGQAWVEEWLEKTMGKLGEPGINQIRDTAKEVALIGGWDREYKKLDSIIGTLLGSHKGQLLSERAVARSQGEPFDQQRLELFTNFSSYLKQCQFIHRKVQSDDIIAFENTAFWDAYFSNYIEGTQFPVEEAEDIIFNRNINESRHEDSHNVIRSYDLLADKNEMGKLPDNVDEFMDILVTRHRYFMAESPEKKPGEFKRDNNVAGNTVFVDWDRVEGTLSKGFNFYLSMDCPVKKAIYIMFLVAEVHPFIDGNGRIARMMMNADLISADLERILIPTCYRDDYLSGLRSITRNQNFNAYCRMLDRAHHFTASFNYLDLEGIVEKFKNLRVFDEGNEGRLPELNYRKNMSVIT